LVFGHMIQETEHLEKLIYEKKGNSQIATSDAHEYAICQIREGGGVSFARGIA
jgi:hypothetical protein